MSLDINWELLSHSDTPHDILSDSLITLLNQQLAHAHRPSFIGPITVTAFDFGSAGPDLEIKDIRDVWRVFDQGDDEGDLVEEEKEREREREEREKLKSEALRSALDGEKYELVESYGDDAYYEDELERELQYQVELEERREQRGRRPHSYAHPHAPHAHHAPHTHTAHTSHPRPGVSRSTSQRSFIPYPFDHPAPTPHLPSTPGLNPSLFSHPLSARLPASRRPLSAAAAPLPHPAPLPSRRRNPLTLDPSSSTPPSPPAHPSGLPPKQSSSIPSLQLHLHLSHTSDLHLTLLTSLQVNYPSTLFMALPLKISITGWQMDAEVVLAYSGEKNRVHLTLVDDDSPRSTPEERNLPLGQRILSNLQIESEIGHADAHVLRNVGKVERFIVDVVRKTLVDELVFPNFHTVAL
ncbi:hypothetical protein IAT38_002516 [Cryptococcus sp. DSM 104549]